VFHICLFHVRLPGVTAVDRSMSDYCNAGESVHFNTCVSVVLFIKHFFLFLTRTLFANFSLFEFSLFCV